MNNPNYIKLYDIFNNKTYDNHDNDKFFDQFMNDLDINLSNIEENFKQYHIDIALETNDNTIESIIINTINIVILHMKFRKANSTAYNEKHAKLYFNFLRKIINKYKDNMLSEHMSFIISNEDYDEYRNMKNIYRYSDPEKSYDEWKIIHNKELEEETAEMIKQYEENNKECKDPNYIELYRIFTNSKYNNNNDNEFYNQFMQDFDDNLNKIKENYIDEDDKWRLNTELVEGTLEYLLLNEVDYILTQMLAKHNSVHNDIKYHKCLYNEEVLKQHFINIRKIMIKYKDYILDNNLQQQCIDEEKVNNNPLSNHIDKKEQKLLLLNADKEREIKLTKYNNLINELFRLKNVIDRQIVLETMRYDKLHTRPEEVDNINCKIDDNRIQIIHDGINDALEMLD